MFWFVGCKPFQSDSVNNTYPEIDDLLNNQLGNLYLKGLEKNVQLDGEEESKVLSPDSAQWVKELSFLKEINPNSPKYVGAFIKEEIPNGYQLLLKDGEKNNLKSIVFTKQDKLSQIEAVVHESKDIFTHHKNINLDFSDGLLQSYQVDGYQKIATKDTIRFKIEAQIKN